MFVARPWFLIALSTLWLPAFFACERMEGEADEARHRHERERERDGERGGEREREREREEEEEGERTPNPWFFLERAYPFDKIERADWERAQLEARALKEQGGPRAGSWTFRGPTNVGGRITDLAVDPRDANVVYAAAAEGGVLRSTDAGQHWTPLFDEQATLSVGALALDPTNPDIVLAGTGEVNPGGGSVAYGGSGVYRSTNQGATWTPLGLEGTGSIGRIRFHPSDPNRIYVAAMGDLWSKDADRGVYRTTNGGSSWDRVLFVSDSTGAVDLVVRPDQPNVIFAAMWERIRRPKSYQYGGTTCAVYKTTDGGTSWSVVAGGLPASSSQRGRIGLSLCQAQPDVMTAIYADRTGNFDGLYRSTNGGTSWTRTNDGTLSGVFATYGWWFGNVRVHPVDPARIFVVGYDFYRSTNGGTSYGFAGDIMHVDHHALEFGPGASPVMYCGNDGGVYRSVNGGTVWSKLPELPILQVYGLALDPSNANTIVAGAQDNGTVRTTTGLLNDWTDLFGGDGMRPAIHPTQTNRMWVQYQYGALQYSSNGGGSFVDATSGISPSDRRAWNSPIRIDPTNPNRQYFGTNRLYRSTNGTSWSAVSPDLTMGAGSQQGQVYGTLTTIDVSPQDGNVLWTGSDDGRVHVSTNGGTNWTDVSLVLPDRWITSVRTDPTDRENACVTISGFRWHEPLPHVYRTTNLGSTWAPIASNLPEAPANDLAFDPANPARLFIATDVGVFETLDTGTSWHVLGGNLPNVVVTSLAFNATNRTLTAGTFGRSLYSYDIDQPSAVDPGPGTPAALAELGLPSPNPTTAGARVEWNAVAAARVAIELVSVSGRRLLATELRGGRGVWNWDGRDAAGAPLPAGVYYARLVVDGRPAAARVLTVTR